MDKNKKFSQSSSKGTNSDVKKNQDNSNNKLFPKNPRRREPSVSFNFPQNEPPRKSNTNTQKTKNFDKRPKPKGQYYGGSKTDSQVVEEDIFGSVTVQGSKKQNLNHLLNFHYQPRDVQRNSNTWGHRKSTSNHWLLSIQRHKYNKEQFLQASCQFVVAAKEDYSSHLINPDLLVDWKFIEQVKIHTSESISCPICLYPPIAGKITRCGHVYCWPCILHYLSLSDKSWRQCPICDESIQKTDLKSVVEITHTTFNLGDQVTLKLMRREKGSLLAIPVTNPQIDPPVSFSYLTDNIDNQAHSKLLIAEFTDILNIIESERAQLKVEMNSNPHCPENCYIEQALDELSKRQANLLQTESFNHTNDQTLGGEPTATANQKFFYFYQAEDGQYLYLHAMNVKMLEMQYGSLENSPLFITGKLLEKEGGSLTEEVRRRMRYLAHLPITCQIELAEIELKPPIVSEEVIDSFHDQLVLRQKHRKRREKEERTRDEKILEEENKRMGKYPIPQVNIDSKQHFPRWQPESFLNEDKEESPVESANSSIVGSPSLSSFDEMVTQDQGPSFAEMLRSKGAIAKCKLSTNAWPLVGNNSSRPSTSNTYNTIDSEDYPTAPPYNQSFGDALALALEQSKFLDTNSKTTSANGNKKKKKKKSTVLFATNMACSP